MPFSPTLLCKKLEALSSIDVFALFKLRCAVFVVEQNCPYQDIDSIDRIAHHVLMFNQNQLIGCTRFFCNDQNQIQIGRVAIDKNYRGNRLAHKLFSFSIDRSLKTFGEKNMMLSSQTYLIDFYAQFGFKSVGKPFLEDDIPHQHMIKTITSVNQQ